MLQDVIHPPPPPLSSLPSPAQPPTEQISIEEISSPINARIFELCDDELFPEAGLQSSEVTSTSNCCFEEAQYKTNTVTTPTSTTQDITASAAAVAANNNNNKPPDSCNNLSVIFDSQEDLDNDISASIDFSSSPAAAFPVPSLLPNITTQPEQFDFSSPSVLKGLPHQYPTDTATTVVVPPLMGNPLVSSVFEDECMSSMASYVPINSSSAPSCSYLSPAGLGVFMPPLTTALSADSALFGGNILLGSELQAQEIDYQGENGGIFCTDSIQRVFNPPDLQTLSSESQQLVPGSGGSATLAPEISNLEDSTLKVGKLSVEQRKEKIHRYMKKRNERNFSKKIKYACRKTLADSRPRVRGRFAKNDDFGENHRPACSNHEEDDEEEIVVKEDDGLVDSSDIFAHISGVNSFKCNYSSIQSWI
ncbi:uncharacterized protein LOC107474385 [Arachis duranensis]|uniref:Uncharacterized protein LOC107474385 n=1 Tax=Arachis duranensis TaxID=130453 RepID=A0A6P4CD82_ARADU|nr:uncharacterized protein LOC107474385 [Arachis duranensis]XP_025648125.1 proline and serine-rich protein 1 [Arachis hypogaea]QHO53789.1 Zinc finger protein CONSTANS-LIKE [Arachis hypogaea]